MTPLHPILSVIVRDHERGILIGVRNPATNKTHPNVVSTPTMRIPQCLADALLERADFNEVAISELHFPGRTIHAYQPQTRRVCTYTGLEQENQDPLMYLVTTLFSRKLSHSPLPRFTAHVASVVEGTLLYDEAEALPGMDRDEKLILYEDAQMIGVEVLLRRGDLFPLNTVSYSQLAYVPEELFKEMVRTRSTDPVADVLGKKSLMYCVKGMCLLAAYAAMSDGSLTK